MKKSIICITAAILGILAKEPFQGLLLGIIAGLYFDDLLNYSKSLFTK